MDLSLAITCTPFPGGEQALRPGYRAISQAVW